MVRDFFDIPILLITFNRPETTELVLSKILQVNPSQLYVFSDGPREGRPDEEILVNECRELIESSKFPDFCKLDKWFTSTNMGCGIGPSSAISWAFESVDKLIILEDDCIPEISFFDFCREMLQRYKYNNNVMHIAGTRWNSEFNIGEKDHFFSKIAHIWGWATWKRAWDKYDFTIKQLPDFKSKNILSKVFQDKRTIKYWHQGFDTVASAQLAAWDYQWQFALFANEGLAIVPNVNLVSNIGIQGIHYTGEKSNHLFRKTQTWISSPDDNIKIEANKAFDKYHMFHRFLKKEPLHTRLYKRLRKLINVFK